MIIVVEGISASGKSMWCAKNGAGHIIPENGPLRDAPDIDLGPERLANFWAERNVDRWRAAVALAEKVSLAVCDTDPLKLHYIWSLWQIGEAAERDWRLQLAATRERLAQQRIGFADCYVVGEIDPVSARERARMDPARRRRNFNLHVRLQPALLTWCSALEAALNGRVVFGFPENLPNLTHTGLRYDVTAFDRMIDALPRTPAGSA